jgi:hypothetical protein
MACDTSLKSIWPDDLYFVVPVSGSPYINNNENIITLPAEFKNWKVRVFRNNGLLDYGQQIPGDPYWNWDQTQNTIGLSTDAQTFEKFLIVAVKPAVD